MKFILFFEFNPKDFDKVIEINKTFVENKTRNPDDYPELVFGPYFLGDEFKGFDVVEASTPEQLMNNILHYMPTVKIKFQPILDGYQIVELYQKSKQ